MLTNIWFCRSDEAKRLKKKKEREEKIRENSKIWKDDIIDNYGKYQGGRKVKDLCWQGTWKESVICSDAFCLIRVVGIPPNLRKSVWPLLIGNRLSISEELFEIHGGRAFEVRKHTSLEGMVDDMHLSNKEQSVLLIPVDIGRTFPLLGFFQEEG